MTTCRNTGLIPSDLSLSRLATNLITACTINTLSLRAVSALLGTLELQGDLLIDGDIIGNGTNSLVNFTLVSAITIAATCLQSNVPGTDLVVKSNTFFQKNVVIEGDLTVNGTIITDLVPSGVMFWFFGPTVPTGYLLCDGTAVSRFFFASLFAVLGITYGPGDGLTTFNLPDLVTDALFVRGTAAPANVNQTDAIEAHNHSVTDPGHNHLQNAHAHAVTDPGHNHTQNSHIHGITDPGHNHTQNSHIHSVTDPGHIHSITDPGHDHPDGAALSAGNSDFNGGTDPLDIDATGTNTTGITVDSATTGVSVDGTTATNNSNTTGVSVDGTTATNNSNTTGLTVDSVTATNITNVTSLTVDATTAGTGTFAAETRPVNIALMPCVKI